MTQHHDPTVLIFNFPEMQSVTTKSLHRQCFVSYERGRYILHLGKGKTLNFPNRRLLDAYLDKF